MTNYLTSDTDLTSVANAIREKGGTSESLEWPTGYVNAVGAISGGPILNPLCGTEMLIENGSITYQYEFDSSYGNPTGAGIGGCDFEGLSVSGSSFDTAQLNINSNNLLTITNSSTINGGCVFLIEFVGGNNYSGYTADTVWFDGVKVGLYHTPCYLRGTLITLVDGSQKPVEEITYDDELLVGDFDEGKLSSAKPLGIKCPQQKIGYHHLTLESGKTLDVVGTNGKAHRLLDIDVGEFVWSTDMVGHRTITLDGEDKLISCEGVEKSCEYYNIITEHHINCYANNILTSCRYNNIYPIRDMRFIKKEHKLIPFDAYDVPRRFYDGMRLSEQTIPVDKTNDYIACLVKFGSI